MNLELELISKVIEEKDITKALNSKVSNCIRIYRDVWDHLEQYYIKYRAVPSKEILLKKFPDLELTESTATMDYLIDEVNNDFLRYRLESIITEAARSVEDSPREALSYLFAKSSTLGHQTDVVKDVDLASDFNLRVDNLKARAVLTDQGHEILGIPSSIDPLDYLFGGFQSGDFCTLMGWTGSGKTWLASYLAVQAWKHGKVPLYFSLEMDDVQFGYRIDTLMSGGSLSNTGLMNARNVSPEMYGDWANQTYKDRQPFYIVTNEGMDEVNQLTVQNKIEQYKPDIVFLDYHSLFDDAKRGRNETERHRNLSKDFKRMAVRFGVPIIDIVGVTMEDNHGQRPPELHEVAWSKQLAYDSDLVLSVCKEGQLMTVEAKKVRRGDLFAFRLTWDFDNGIVNTIYS